MRVRIDEIYPGDDDPENPPVGSEIDATEITASMSAGPGWFRMYYYHRDGGGGRTYVIGKYTEIPEAPAYAEKVGVSTDGTVTRTLEYADGSATRVRRTTEPEPIERVCPRSPETCCQSEPCRGPVPLFMSADSEERKLCPVTTGFDAYFPDAKMCVAFVSYNGNQKHNPGQPLHWDKSKSADEKDAEGRHMLDALRGLPPDPGLERLGKLGHLASKAWRAMADLQRACDEERKAYEGGE